MADKLDTSKSIVGPDLSRFDWGDVAVFLALARHKSLSGAARSLNVNHSTIGRRVRELESALETKLFERTRHGFLLTDAGEMLFKDAEGVEAHISNIALQFSGEASRISGTVRVATMEALGSLYLSPRFVDLYEKVPSINVELVTAAHWINLSKREADVLISFPKPIGHRIDSEKIGEFALFLYASQDYLDRHGTPQSIDDLKHHRFVGYIDELIMISAVRWLSDVLRNQDAQFRSTSLVAQYHATASGLGIAMLPTFVAGNDPRLVRILPSQIKVKRDFWLSVHHDLEHIARVKQVMKFLKHLIQDNADFLNGD
ncbi:MAG: LysR family transcriptional regulator [Rhodospirillales bacterium]